MNFLNKVTVVPSLPEKIKGLKDLSRNMWWTWNYDSQELFEEIDGDLWKEVNRNPVIFLKQVSQKKLEEKSSDKKYCAKYDKVMKKFDQYLNEKNTWFNATHKDYSQGEIAYFCAEYGIHESLPIYSGGLGILAGDHVKSASDLGLPFVAVGFLYREGYFIQQIDKHGQQHSHYEHFDFSNFPVEPAKDENDDELYVNIKILGRAVYVKVWKLNVGRVTLYLLDTDIKQNDPEDRKLTHRLYGGDHEMRIKQEMLLGIAGVRALRKMNINPSVWHMNEGHAAFLSLERTKEYVQNDNLSFEQATEITRAGSVFTTHTPVPAGNDAFDFHLIEKYFSDYWPTLDATRDEFFDLGREQRPDGSQAFSMTILALKMAGRANGVSELHGKVSRGLWKHVWKGLESVEVPISHVTNGVHSETWIAKDLQDLFASELDKNWVSKLDDPDMWAKIDNIPNDKLWNTHIDLKGKLVDFIHERVKAQRARHGETVEQLQEIKTIGDKNILTLGFARRFATYKRATLIFRDLERLEKILNNPEKPVQIVFAGKAHPADKPGQELIKRIYEISRMPQFKDKIIILENYDMNMGRHLVSGVDIWLNNPRRPHEASGTSGEKAGMNGAMNFSVLDGWWVEGFNGDEENRNGWAIGDNRDYDDKDLQDRIDSVSMYNTLENEIIPAYYAKDKSKWIKIMKNSISSTAEFFNTSRMLKEYTQKLYMPAAVQAKKFSKDEYKVTKDFAHWRNLLERNWQSIKIKVLSNQNMDEQFEVGKEVEIEAEVYLPGIGPDSIEPEIVLARIQNEEVITLKTFKMKLTKEAQKDTYIFNGSFEIDERGYYGYNVRISASHPYMPHKNYLMGLVKHPAF